MEIEYNGSGGRPLCFYHAVKAVIDNDEKIRADCPEINHHDFGGTGYLGQSCVECFPPDKYDDYDDDED